MPCFSAGKSLKIDGWKPVLYAFPMKTWITYIAAVLMGLATALLFGDTSAAAGILSWLSSFLVDLGIFITIPVIVLTFPPAVASLGKDMKGRKAAASIIGWSIITAIVLPLAGALIFTLSPVSFPVTSTAGSTPGTLAALASYYGTAALSSLYPRNAFLSIAASMDFILPAIIICWIFGLALRPSCDTIRPAYTVMNSFSEVMHRISRTYAVLGSFLVYGASASLFIDLYQEKTAIAAPRFGLLVLIASAAAAVLILPLLYGAMTGFRKNPYRLLYRSLAPMLAGFSAGSIIAAIPIAESISRQNLGVQKRVSSVAIPLSAAIGKAGSAFVSVQALLALFQATAMSRPSFAVALAAAGAAALISFASSASAGSEIAFITVMSLRLLGIDLYGGENAVLALLPLLCGFGALLDAEIAVMSASIASVSIDTDIEVPISDTI